MNRYVSFALGTVSATLLYAGAANAQATRTWVSGVGDDANPCSRTAPCKTFAGAISKTAANGEIDCLDPGGFGAVTITKSITIDCTHVAGGVLTTLGTNGVVINGAGVIVKLRNLGIQGAGTGGRGIHFVQGSALHLENVVISGFRNSPGIGINFAPSTSANLFVTDSFIDSNGIGATSGGINVAPTGGATVFASIVNTKLHFNTMGLLANSAGGLISATVRGSSVASNTSGGIEATAGANLLTLTVDDTTVVNNVGIGLRAVNGNALIRLGGSTISGNGTGLSAAGGFLQSYKNNQIAGNFVADGTPITAVPGGPLN